MSQHTMLSESEDQQERSKRRREATRERRREERLLKRREGRALEEGEGGEAMRTVETENPAHSATVAERVMRTQGQAGGDGQVGIIM